MTPYGVIPVAGFRAAGSALLQTWQLSEDDRAFIVGVLSDKLGEPHSETLASRENVALVGGVVLNAPGAVTTYRETPQAEQEPDEVPAESGWPPQVGDVWRDAQGDDWHAVGTILGVRMRLDGTAGYNTPWHVLGNYGPLQLVKR